MKSEYKRDMNHNYLVLHGDEEIDTSAYQVRMLVGNVIPSFLKCRIQGLDGKFSVYYDITSRQSLVTFYENRKLGCEDLRLIFGEFIRVMEDAAEYLMNPGHLVLLPEYMFLEVEKKELSFCFMPGYQKEVREQFLSLTEYLLPKIDHGDDQAVVIGYGVYRRAMEDSFHLEHIKEELYKARAEKDGKNRDSLQEFMPEADKAPEMERKRMPEGELFAEEDFWGNREMSGRRKEKEGAKQEGCRYGEREKTKAKKSQSGKLWKEILGFGICILLLAGILMLKMLGYLPEVSVEVILGAVLVGMASGMLIYVIRKKIKMKKEAEEARDARKYQRRERAREEREYLRREYEEKNFTREIGEKNISLDMAKIAETEENVGKWKNTESKLPFGNFPEKEKEELPKNFGETVVLSMSLSTGTSSLVSREPGEFATIYLEKELTVIGKLKNASDAVIDLPTVSRVHAKIRKRDGAYYLTDLNSRNGTTVNGRLLRADEEYCLQNEDEVDFAQARYVFLE